jgi:hypothetical protein
MLGEPAGGVSKADRFCVYIAQPAGRPRAE